MHHVYCDACSAEVLTPDFNDAKRQFNRMVREHPGCVVDWDELKNAVPPSTSESGELEHDGRKRIMQSDPA